MSGSRIEKVSADAMIPFEMIQDVALECSRGQVNNIISADQGVGTVCHTKQYCRQNKQSVYDCPNALYKSLFQMKKRKAGFGKR